MRPFLETVSRPAGSSLAMLNRRLDDGIPFQWHHHPEFELTLTLNSEGQRFIGDHTAPYGDRDLVLVSPNQPHTWVSNRAITPNQPHIALVIWFTPDWAGRLAQDVVEFQSLGQFLTQARQGLAFSRDLAHDLQPKFERVFEQSPSDRLLTLLHILERLRQDTGATPLASAPTLPVDQSGGPARIERLLTHIHQHYTNEIRMQELADVAALSVSGVHRLFRKHTKSTVTDYIVSLRIGDACARLMGSDQPIAHIADEVGYRSLANFNRQFKAAQHMTPRKYRMQFRGGSQRQALPGY